MSYLSSSLKLLAFTVILCCGMYPLVPVIPCERKSREAQGN